MSASTVNLTINTSDLYQKVLGFGGAVTDSMALSVKNLSAATQNHLIRSYYSADGKYQVSTNLEANANLTIGKNCIMIGNDNLKLYILPT